MAEKENTNMTDDMSTEEQTVTEQAADAAEAAEIQPPAGDPFVEPDVPEIDAAGIQEALDYESQLERARQRLEDASRSLPPSVAREEAQEIQEARREVNRIQSRMENAPVPDEELVAAITSLPLEVEDLRYQVRDLEAQGRLERAKLVQAELDQRIRVEAAARQELQFRRDDAVRAETIQRNREDAALRVYQSEMNEAVRLAEQGLQSVDGDERAEMETRLNKLRYRAENPTIEDLREDPVYVRALEQTPDDVLPQSAMRIVTGRDGQPHYVDPIPLAPKPAPEPELTPVERAQANVRAAFQAGDDAGFDKALAELAKVRVTSDGS